MMFAAMNLLAFALHTVCDCLERRWIEARTAKRARTRFFEHIRTITAYLVFPDWVTLMQTLIDSNRRPMSKLNSHDDARAAIRPIRIAGQSGAGSGTYPGMKCRIRFLCCLGLMRNGLLGSRASICFSASRVGTNRLHPIA